MVEYASGRRARVRRAMAAHVAGARPAQWQVHVCSHAARPDVGASRAHRLEGRRREAGGGRSGSCVSTAHAPFALRVSGPSAPAGARGRASLLPMGRTHGRTDAADCDALSGGRRRGLAHRDRADRSGQGAYVRRPVRYIYIYIYIYISVYYLHVSRAGDRADRSAQGTHVRRPVRPRRATREAIAVECSAAASASVRASVVRFPASRCAQRVSRP
jgi:hypothetical protein